MPNGTLLGGHWSEYSTVLRLQIIPQAGQMCLSLRMGNFYWSQRCSSSVHLWHASWIGGWGCNGKKRNKLYPNPSPLSNSTLGRYCLLPCLISAISSSSSADDNPHPRRQPGGYEEELLGLDVYLPSRNAVSGAPRPRSWFGPNGQYMRELPCPVCRGRGYAPCTDCGIQRSQLNCPRCSGKGIVTCHRCFGECVVWEESIDEQPWEKARSISPIKVHEDDELDSIDIKLEGKKWSNRVRRSRSPEVGLKISRSLKSLNEKTGLFTKKMKILHRNPVLEAQRIAAIKKSKGNPAARKRASEAQKSFFSNPENRRKRSLVMKGVRFYCSHCGREGHRRHYCPELKDSLIDRRSRCRVCGQKGHNQRTCSKFETRNAEQTLSRCRICGQSGHNKRTCPQRPHPKRIIISSKMYSCRLCGGKGHNSRSCPMSKSQRSEEKEPDPDIR
ncbi:hypothetical protein MLD38_019505 [Melastoma candidum]|uniref:Uncharacterized protein n=1 Tax=Melastoma candidum TaxID=119954 RepID=A0ACB9QYB2_9MYRT|nr:hypothetical protein MLD38_019505 [Melastoma candidum]